MSGLGIVAAAAVASAQGTVAGGPHDLVAGTGVRLSSAGGTGVGTQTCVFCHTPHGGSTSLPLWNRNAPSATGYQLYASSTTELAQTSATAVTTGMSGACLSCHDGSMAMDVLADVNGFSNPTGKMQFAKQGTSKANYVNDGTGTGNKMAAGGGNAFMSNDLRNDHPVAVSYTQAKANSILNNVTSDLNSEQTVGGRIVIVGLGGTKNLPLFGASSTVECSTCHDAHNNSNGSFLIKPNTGSALCLDCHIK